MSDVKIAGCYECPLRAVGTCAHPDAEDRADTANELRDAARGHDATGREVLRAPTWCPLRQGVLTITLRTKGESKVPR